MTKNKKESFIPESEMTSIPASVENEVIFDKTKNLTDQESFDQVCKILSTGILRLKRREDIRKFKERNSID